MSYEWLLHLYISYDYNFKKFILHKYIYITISNISVFKRKLYLKNVSNNHSLYKESCIYQHLQI